MEEKTCLRDITEINMVKENPTVALLTCHPELIPNLTTAKLHVFMARAESSAFHAWLRS